MGIYLNSETASVAHNVERTCLVSQATYSRPRSEFYGILRLIEARALQDGWLAFFVGSVYLSVVRSGRSCELFKVAHLDDEDKALVFDILQLKGHPGWCSDALEWLASRIEDRWRHKLSWSAWDRSVASQKGMRPAMQSNTH